MFQGEHSEIFSVFPLNHEFFSLEIARLFSSQRDLSKIGRTFTLQGISLLQGPLWVCSCRDQTDTIVFVESHERRRNAHQKKPPFPYNPVFVIRTPTVWDWVNSMGLRGRRSQVLGVWTVGIATFQLCNFEKNYLISQYLSLLIFEMTLIVVPPHRVTVRIRWRHTALRQQCSNDDGDHGVFPQRCISCLQFLLFLPEVREERERNSTFQPPQKDPIFLSNSNLPSTKVTTDLLFIVDTNILHFYHLFKHP